MFIISKSVELGTTVQNFNGMLEFLWMLWWRKHCRLDF